MHNDERSWNNVSRASIVVSIDIPYNVLMCDPNGLFTLIEFTPEELQGRSLTDLFGPRTNVSAFEAAIRNVNAHQKSALHIALYGRSGEWRNLVASCSPFYGSTSELIGCFITLEKSDCITIKEAIADSANATALVSSETPNLVHMVNDVFTRLLGFSQSDVIGSSIDLIHSKRRDAAKWLSLMESACTGRRCTGNLLAQSASGAEIEAIVTFVPVSEAMTSHIGSIQISIIPLPPSPMSQISISPLTPSPMHGCARPVHFHVSKMIAEETVHSPHIGSSLSATFVPGFCPEYDNIQDPLFPSNFGGQAGESGLSDCFAAVTHDGPAAARKTPAPIITPRRKPCDAGDDVGAGAGGGPPPSPVSVTLELLERMADVTITEAARRIGVSITSLKKACRKLGVERWPYRKDAPPAARAPLTHCDFDEAYVRRLNRKYGLARSTTGPAKPAAGPGPTAHGTGTLTASQPQATSSRTANGADGDTTLDGHSAFSSFLPTRSRPALAGDGCAAALEFRVGPSQIFHEPAQQWQLDCASLANYPQ